MKKNPFLRFCLFTGIAATSVLSGCSKDNTDPSREPEPPHRKPVTFTIAIGDCSEQGAEVTVTTSSEAVYYCGIHTEASLQGVGDQALLEQLAVLEGLSGLLHSEAGRFTVEQTLTPSVSYKVVVAGYDDGQFTGDLARSESFTVESPQPAAFSFEVRELTYHTAVIDIAPLDGELPYFAEVKEAAKMDQMTDDRIIESIISLYGPMADFFTYTGAATISSAADFGELVPDTEYYVMAFGYADGAAATGLVRQKFRTEAPADPTTNVFTFAVDEVGGRTASVRVTPSQPSVLYVWDVITEENYLKYGGSKDAIDGYLEAYIRDQINETFPTKEAVVAVIGVRGEKDNDYEFLMPETTYYVWAVCVDASGNPVAEPALSEPFTTEKVVVSAATAAIGFDKFYDGSELYKTDPDTYSNYNGKAYLPVTVIHSEDAVEWYTLYTTTDVGDPSLYTDDILTKNLLSQGTAGGETRYYAIPWNETVYLLAVAKDADGNCGSVFRRGVTLNPADASPVAEMSIPSYSLAEKPIAAIRFEAR